MANLTVARVCNLNCPYCFASRYMDGASNLGDESFISRSAFVRHLDFLKRSRITQVRLIGGEPTLHPHFPELIGVAIQRDFQIMVFSHGLIAPRPLACLSDLEPAECLVLINMNAMQSGDQPTARESKRREAVVTRLGLRALLGFNIYQVNFNLDPLLALIDRARCQRRIRLGLAQPILDGSNAFLHPKQYRAVASRIVRFARQAAEADVVLEFDCGFVRCMFTEDDIGALRDTGTDFGWRCNPILDLSLDGEAIHCFPLAGRVQTTVTVESDAQTLRRQLVAQTRAYRLAGIYRECSSCSWKQRGDCTGGCLAQTMRRFRQPELAFRVPGPESSQASEAVNDARHPRERAVETGEDMRPVVKDGA